MATYDLPPQHERGPLPLNYLHGAATPAASDDDRRPPAPFVKRSAAHRLPRLAPPHDRREAYVQRPCRAAKPVDVVEAKVLCGRASVMNGNGAPADFKDTSQVITVPAGETQIINLC